MIKRVFRSTVCTLVLRFRESSECSLINTPNYFKLITYLLIVSVTTGWCFCTLSGGTTRDPDYLIRIHLRGEVPSSIVSIIDDFPDRELSGDFYELTGFDKPGKEIKVRRNDVQVQFLDCNERNCPRFSHITIYFFKLSNRTSFSQIGNVFDLSCKSEHPNRFTQTVVGLIEEPLHVTEKERNELSYNLCIEYRELTSADKRNLEKLLLRIIKRSLGLTFLLKVACIGSKRKTKLIRLFVEGKFETNYLPTLGVDITTKRINLYGIRVNLIIVDTAGQEFFGKLRPSYYRGSSGCLIFFDCHESSSLIKIKNWHEEFRTHVPDPYIPIALVGFMTNNETIKRNELERLTKELGVMYYEIYEGERRKIYQVFEDLIAQIFKAND